MVYKKSKLSTDGKKVYYPLLSALKKRTNLKKIEKDFDISKQNLNKYLRRLEKDGLIIHKGRGWYELNRSKLFQLEYGSKPSNRISDTIRGHAMVWNVNFPQEIKGWDKRIELLDKHRIHYKLVGFLKNIPRIKLLGRKIWLCNKHLRIFDNPKSSYYGKTAKESRYYALNEISLILDTLNTKFGLNLKLIDVSFQKEHYSLIKNELAIEHNKRGEQVHVSDKFGEWLLMDDSNFEGGELENVGKSAYNTNPKLQKWWNEHKETNFEVTPKFILETFSKVANNQAKNEIQVMQYAKQIELHLKLIQEYRKENILWRKDKIKEIKDEVKHGKQTNIWNFTTKK